MSSAAMSIDRQCASGLMAIATAAKQIIVDGMQITIGSTLVVDAFFFQGPTEHAGTIDLVAGRRYPIRIRYFQGGGETEAHVAWQPPGSMKEVVPTARLYPMN